MSKAGKFYDRAGLWETRSKQAMAKGDDDRAGKLRTKALQLLEKGKKAEAEQKQSNIKREGIILILIDGDEFYAGKEYVVQQEKYTYTTEEKDKAKVYKSKKVAQKVVDRINYQTNNKAEIYQEGDTE